MFADLLQDLRVAVRMLRKAPGFTAVAVLTLALGIGANAAIFSVINAVVLQPLPFAAPDRLVRIWESNPSRGWPTFGVSHPNYLDWAAQTQTFERLAATVGASFTLTGSGDPERLIAMGVTHGFLPVLGINPALGRNFLPEEDRPGGSGRVALLTHTAWKNRFGSDPAVINRTITLTNEPYTIVGVLPERFVWDSPTLELLVPLAPDPARPRGDHRLRVVGRLKPGVSLEQADAELRAIARQLEQQYPKSNEGWTVFLLSFYDWMVPEQTRRSLTMFAVAVVAVLLIACSNVASLMLARAMVRQREMAVRLAIGSRRGRLVRQLMVEAVVLAGAGGAAGLAVAYGATRVLVSLRPGNIPRLDEVGIDVTVLAFALAISMITGILFGLVPAFAAMRTDVNDTLKEGARGGSGSRRGQRLRNVLVVGELALSVALLVGAGMLLRSFWQVQKVHPGFDTERLLTMQITLPLNKYRERPEQWGFYRRLLEQLSALPGVQAAALTSLVPLGAGNTGTEVRMPGLPAQADNAGSADWRIVSPGYFRTMGIPLRGRDFTERDDFTGERVTIISEEMARRYWPGEDAIGRQVILTSFGSNPSTVIGVVGDVRSFGLDAGTAPMVYMPAPAGPGWNPMSIVVRTAGDPTLLVSPARGVLRAIDATVPFYGVTTVDELLGRSMGPRRFTMLLIGSAAGVALVLACVGLFGVMAYLVSQRSRELGIRLALGALPRDVFRLVLGRGALLAAAGAALGIAAAFRLAPLLESFLFDIDPLDTITFAAAPVVLIVIALLASYLPARRAMRLDPVMTLRDE